MSRGKFLSLEEARQSGESKRFCDEHPSEADRRRLLALTMSQGRRRARLSDDTLLSRMLRRFDVTGQRIGGLRVRHGDEALCGWLCKRPAQNLMNPIQPLMSHYMKRRSLTGV